MANKINGYTVVAYPESIPKDYSEKLDVLPFGYKSALHDKDVNPETGQLKKAHIHFFFQGNPTKRQKEYIQASLGVAYGEPVRDLSGMYDYLTHENDPDKFHYSRDIIQTSRKWCQEAFEMHYTPKFDTRADLLRCIADNDIHEYYELVEFVATLNRPDLESECTRYWVMRYLDSRRYSSLQKSHSARKGELS